MDKKWVDRVKPRHDGKIIWQIWHDWNHERDILNITPNSPGKQIKGLRKSIPDHWKSSPESIKRLHPNWDYYLLDEEENRNFVAHYFPDFLHYYDNYPYPIQRVDAIRYLRQYVHGGLYIDLDMEVLKPLDDLLLEKEDLVFLQSEKFFNYITNPFFYCRKPKHPFWLKVIDEMKHPPPWWALTKHFIVMTTTGPLMLSRAYQKWCHASSNFQEISHNPSQSQIYPATLIPSKYILPCSMCDQHCITPNDSYIKQLPGMSWISWDSKIYNFFYCHYKEIILTVIIIILFLLWLYFYSGIRQ